VKNAPALTSGFLTDPALRARLGIQARAQHAVRFEIRAYVDKLE
jgi:hypothetical protein